MPTKQKSAADPVAKTEARFKNGEVSRQYLHKVRKQHGVTGTRKGAPSARARDLATRKDGKVLVKTELPRAFVERMRSTNLRGLSVLTGACAAEGFRAREGRAAELRTATDRAVPTEDMHALKVPLTRAMVERMDKAVARDGLRGRNVLVAMCVMAGFDAREAKRSQIDRSATDSG